MEKSFSFESLGTQWRVTIFDDIHEETYRSIQDEVIRMCSEFDATYSRFKEDSLVTKLSHTKGTHTVPRDLVEMLRLYKKFFTITEKRFTPCIGHLLEDVGYDSVYSLIPKETMRPVYDFDTAVEIVDDETINLTKEVLLDLGALGKGYCVDVVTEYLYSVGIKRFLVDGSGDIFYEGNGMPITVGLEHPGDATQVIGSIEMMKGAMCSSATNRRSWGKYSHYIDPTSATSPEEIIATWVIADTASMADALSSVLFFVAPESVPDTEFSYCILNRDYKIKKSPDFSATFY